jgi:hypothetical protein
MGSLGFPELLVILAIIIIFGPACPKSAAASAARSQLQERDQRREFLAPWRNFIGIRVTDLPGCVTLLLKIPDFGRRALPAGRIAASVQRWT